MNTQNTQKIRFGCHPFLNAQPLIYPLQNGLVKHNFELIFDSPANLAGLLREKKLDIAIIPSIEYAKGKDYLLIPDFSICSTGKVETVRLYCKKDIGDIKKVAVDKRSQTSVAMLKIILKKKYNLDPEMVRSNPDLKLMLKENDAALIIGDDVFSINSEKLKIYDLGEEWFALTKHTFVHALLAVHFENEFEDEFDILLKSKEIGISKVNEITKSYASKIKIDEEVCRNYLTSSIRYDLGAEEINGLKYFYRLAQQSGLIKKEQEIRFYS